MAQEVFTTLKSNIKFEKSLRPKVIPRDAPCSVRHLGLSSTILLTSKGMVRPKNFVEGKSFLNKSLLDMCALYTGAKKYWHPY